MGNVENVQPALLNAFLLTTKDALMVLEAANRGICPVVSRRLHDSEKTSMVRSGSVFAFDEQTTGIKRWTDGTLWSPSRIIGNYLVYRELESKGEKGQPAEQSTAEATSSVSPSNLPSPSQAAADPFAQNPPATADPASKKAAGPKTTGSTGLQRDVERALIGSLTTSYRFKPNGLVKKTFSNGSLHLISYYTIEDVVAGRLRSPSSLMELSSLEISPRLLQVKNFRLPPLMEIDQDGVPHYLGEETDPATTPAPIEPMVSPTAVHRQLPEGLDIYSSSIAVPSGLASAGYETYPEGQVYDHRHLEQRYQPPHEAIYPLPHGPHPHYPLEPAERYDHYYGQAHAGPSQLYQHEPSAQQLEAYASPSEQRYRSNEPDKAYRQPFPPSSAQPLPTRPYTARAAPVARTIYRTDPYARRASDAGAYVSPPQSHPEPLRAPIGQYDAYQSSIPNRRPPDLYSHPPQSRGQYPPQ